MIKRYKLLAQMLKWLRDTNENFKDVAQERIDEIMKSAPSGSGIDHGTKISYEASRNGRMVFDFSFHHMNEGGYYDGWTEHTLVVQPSLEYDIDIVIKGRDRNQIKEYLYDVYGYWLEEEIDEQAIRNIGLPEEHVQETNVIS
jgi:hypothetical protein